MSNNLSPNSARGIDTSKKVPLGPGRSLMDWIRKAPKRSPRSLPVSHEELAKHNSEKDCWMCVRDVVYDVTPYIDFHPGGRDQIMRGAGIDATELFDTYHPWVNIESMLKTCIVGKIQYTRTFKLPLTPSLKPGTVESFASNNPYFDWMQDDNFVHLFITSNQDFFLRKDHITVVRKPDSNEIHVFVFFPLYVYYLGYKLNHEVSGHEVQIENNRNVKVSLEKRDPRSWKNVGTALKDNKSCRKTTQIAKLKFAVELKERLQLTHDCYLFVFQPDPNVTLSVPLGRHVHLLQPNNQAMIRPYTPVPRTVSSAAGQSSSVNLMIKIYENGLFTSKLLDFDIGEKLLMSIPDGDFDAQMVRDATSVFLLAAGTGITPMLGIIQHCMFEQFLEVRRVRLVFFNKTEQDIVYKEELETLQRQFPQNFSTTNILSESKEGSSFSGRISEDLIRKVITGIENYEAHEENERLFCVCGPRPFTDLGLKILKSFNVPDKCVHAFKG